VPLLERFANPLFIYARKRPTTFQECFSCVWCLSRACLGKMTAFYQTKRGQKVKLLFFTCASRGNRTAGTRPRCDDKQQAEGVRAARNGQFGE
jgi:hypothetical protein